MRYHLFVLAGEPPVCYPVLRRPGGVYLIGPPDLKPDALFPSEILLALAALETLVRPPAYRLEPVPLASEPTPTGKSI